MSIDARIEAVNISGSTVKLHLVPREHDGCAGQSELTIVNPPTLNKNHLSSMIGTEIWGGSGDVLVGDRKWAKRIGYTKIKLIGETP